MAGKAKKYHLIIAAHEAGQIDLNVDSSAKIGNMFDCTAYVVNKARHHLGIKPLRNNKGPWDETHKWNAERRDLLERWTR